VLIWGPYPEMGKLPLIATAIVYFTVALLLREKSRLCSRRSIWVSLLVLVVVMQPYAVPSFAETGTPDSGVFGVVPRFQENLKSMQENIDSIRKESALPAADKKSIDTTLIYDESQRDKWKSQCVEAYDARSRVPPGYSSAGDPGMPRSPDFGSCIDRKRFPRDYMHLTAAAACLDDGSFRLPAAGRPLHGIRRASPIYQLCLWRQSVAAASHCQTASMAAHLCSQGPSDRRDVLERRRMYPRVCVHIARLRRLPVFFSCSDEDMPGSCKSTAIRLQLGGSRTSRSPNNFMPWQSLWQSTAWRIRNRAPMCRGVPAGQRRDGRLWRMSIP
jgi:hypothetical protein